MASNQKEEQSEEIEVIQAIFMDDYVDHTKANGSPEFIIQLVPLQSTVAKDVHAKLDLTVKFTTEYPNDPPVLNFENSKGLSDEDLKILKDEVIRLAQDLSGEVMILQLTQHIQEFLHKYNQPSLSFFEQMLANQMKQEQLNNLEQQKLEAAKVAIDREKDEDVIRQVKEELKKRTAEKRKRQVSQSQSSNQNGGTQRDDNPIRKTTFKCSRARDQQKLFVHNFKGTDEDKKVFCSACYGHFYEGACTLMAIDENTGNQMALCEWKGKLINQTKKVHFTEGETKFDVNSISKQIQSIEQEFNFLKTKIICNGLLSYYFLDIDHNTSSISVKLLMDTISGPCLSTYLQEDGLPLSLLQYICKQIVDGLLFLHAKSVIHQNLNLDTTFVNSNNEVILSGYAVVRRISDLYSYSTENGSKKEKSVATKIFKQDIKLGKKGDIFNLGLIILSLYLGHTNLELPIIIPEDVPEPLNSFLTSCLSENENKISTITQLVNHSFVCDKIVNNPIYNQDKDHGSKDKSSDTNQIEKHLMMPLFRDTLVHGKSRLLNEFDTLEWLGKGGFGSVIKVKNKLDGNMYALKRIRLKPSNSQLNKRMTREVKLLSRLNHESVVRYFNSWIEAEDIQFEGDTSLNETESEIDQSQIKQKVGNSPPKFPQIIGKQKGLEELLLQNDVVEEEIFPQTSQHLTSSWCEMSSDDKRNERSSSSDSSEDEGKCGGRFSRSSSRMSKRSSYHDSSEGIVFNDDSVLQFGDYLDSEEESDNETGTTQITTTNDTTAATTTTTETTDSSNDGEKSAQYLYIQMEYCEKSTLRDVINDGVYKKPEQVRRYFREIVEGLAHVHSQGIIHRDLKPFNIFLDSKDRIKIGDFGLATSHTTIKENPVSYLQLNDPSVASSDKMTGKVGTALYVAPELGVAKGRIKFSQKVDMYSLGIILFEMCYRPLTTGMERVKTIGLLRSENKVLPDDFPAKNFTNEKYVILWLLNHTPDDRPTAQGLLESEYVPHKIEDSQLDELLKHTLNQTNSTRFQRLMSNLFNQAISPVNDQIYDSELHGKTEESITTAANILHYVKRIVVKVFEKHGGIFLETPLLIPKMKLFENLNNVATFIDQSGTQLCLPYDSRFSFARYLSRNNINSMRRYFFGKLYRGQTIGGCIHPAELWECSFDIVTDSMVCSLPIAELMYIVWELLKEFTQLAKRNFYVQINHSNILEAVFLQNNFCEETRQKVISILTSTKNKKNLQSQLQSCFIEMEIQEHIINRVLPLLTFEGTLSKARDALQGLRKTKANVSNLVKQAFSEIEKVLSHLNDLEANIDIHLCTFLTSSSTYNSGITFQFVAENLRKKKYGGFDILAQGGCYNQLIESMSRYAESSILPTAVGVSIAVEKLLLAVAENLKDKDVQGIFDDSVIVCSVVTNKPNVEMLLNVLHQLWSAGISASLFSYEVNQDYTLEEIQDFCRAHDVNCFVVLKDTDHEFVRVKIREKEKFSENRVSRRELCDYIKQKQVINKQTVHKAEHVSKDTETPSLPKQLSLNGGSPSFFFTHVAPFDQPNKKRLQESRFKSKFQIELAQNLGNIDIQVIAASLQLAELKTIAAYLELKDSYDEFDKSVQEIMEIYQKNGQFMKRLCHTIHKVYSESNSLVILYSYLVDNYKVFI